MGTTKLMIDDDYVNEYKQGNKGDIRDDDEENLNKDE